MCLDLAAFLAILSEFSTVGGTSSGTVTWLASGMVGETIAVGGVELTAVAGARVAGSNTWSIDGTTTQQATSFATAIGDSDAVDIVTAVKPTPTSVELTTLTTGPDSEIAFTTSTPATYLLSGSTLQGGSSTIEFYLTVSCSMINVEIWKTKAGYAQALLTAHFVSIATGYGGGEAGAVVSRTMASLSQSNAVTAFSTNDAAFSSTKWGRMYLMLRATVLNIPMITGARGGCFPFGTGGFNGW